MKKLMKNFGLFLAVVLALLVVKTGSASTNSATIKLVAPPYITALPVSMQVPNEGNLTSDANGVVTVTVANDPGSIDLRSLISNGWTVLPNASMYLGTYGVASLPACSGSMAGAYATVNNNVSPCPAPTQAVGGATPKATASQGVSCAVHCGSTAWNVIGW